MPDQLVPLHVTIRPEQQAMVFAYAKDEGLVSTSEAVRRIFTEWRRYKAAESGLDFAALLACETSPEPSA